MNEVYLTWRLEREAADADFVAGHEFDLAAACLVKPDAVLAAEIVDQSPGRFVLDQGGVWARGAPGEIVKLERAGLAGVRSAARRGNVRCSNRRSRSLSISPLALLVELLDQLVEFTGLVEGCLRSRVQGPGGMCKLHAIDHNSD